MGSGSSERLGSRSAAAAIDWCWNLDLFAMNVLPFLDMDGALRCRRVSTGWRSMVDAAGRAGGAPWPLPGEDAADGRRAQRQLWEALQREHALWADGEHAGLREMLAHDLAQQDSLTAQMRQILVDWLLTLVWHCFVEHLERSSLAHLAVQLVDRVLARMPVQRSRFQAVGAVAFGMASTARQYANLRLAERHCAEVQALNTTDVRLTRAYLAHMCAYTYSEQDLARVESEMLGVLCVTPEVPAVAAPADADAETGLPEGWEQAVSRSTGEVYYGNMQTGESTWVRPRVLGVQADSVLGRMVLHPGLHDFVPRLAAAAGLEPLSSLSSAAARKSTPDASLHLTRVLVFILDTVLLRAEFCRFRASHQAAACIMAVLRVQQMVVGPRAPPDWSPHLTFCAGCTREELAPLADRVLAAAADVSEKVVTSFRGGHGVRDEDVPSFSERFSSDFVTLLHDTLTGWGLTGGPVYRPRPYYRSPLDGGTGLSTKTVLSKV